MVDAWDLAKRNKESAGMELNMHFSPPSINITKTTQRNTQWRNGILEIPCTVKEHAEQQISSNGAEHVNVYSIQNIAGELKQTFEKPSAIPSEGRRSRPTMLTPTQGSKQLSPPSSFRETSFEEGNAPTTSDSRAGIYH